MKFSLLLASRSRLSMLTELLVSLVETTKHPHTIEVLIVIDSDDDSYPVHELEQRYSKINLKFFVRDRTEWMHKDYINWVYKKSTGKYVLVLNDDTKFLEFGWDENGWNKLEQYVSSHRDGVVYGFTDNLTDNPNLCAFPLFSRKAVDALGFVLPNERKNWGADYDVNAIYSHPSVNRKLSLPEIKIQHVSHHTGMRKRDQVSFDIEKAFMSQHNVYIPMEDYIEKLSNYIFSCNFSNSKVLVVYNICGISKRENVDYYISAINSILNQDFSEGFHVAISSCLTSDNAKERLVAAFGSLISYNWIQDKLPLNITFNHTIRKCVERFGDFESYLYIDSGINFSSQRNVIQTLVDSMRANDFAMIASQVDVDSGYIWWNIKIDKDKDYVMPIGKTCNLHCQLFSHQMYESYNNKLMPDIFAHHTSESVFSFLTASIGKRWGISHKVHVHHETCMDGASSGFIDGDLLFHAAPKKIDRICFEGQKFGFGYEEYKGICMHDPNKFKNGVALDANLYPFLKTNLYLSDDNFNYGKINHDFVPAMKPNTISIPSPQITCIMVSHNKPEYVKEAINSVLNQTFADWQLVIYDSGILADKGAFNHLTDSRIKLVLTNETQHMQVTKAMAPWCFNEAFRRKHVNGFLVTYLCDDDIFYSNAFETFVNFYKSNPRVKIMYASQDMAIHNGKTCLISGERRALEKRGACIGGPPLDCHVDYLQLCHQRVVVEELFKAEDEVWPEGLGTQAHADGVFMEKLGRIYPIHPIDVKIGQNRRTPNSRYAPSR